MARRRGRGKTLKEALNQRNRLIDYYESTGRSESADRVRKTTDVGGVIGNMADRIRMQGGDPFDYRYMNKKVSFKDRTTTPTDAEYKSAVSYQKRKAYHAQRKAAGLSAG